MLAGLVRTLLPCHAAKCIDEKHSSQKERCKTRTGNKKRRHRGPRLRIYNKTSFGSARAARPRTGTSPTASATALRARASAEHRLRLHRQQAFALQLLARELARAANGFGLFTGLLFGGLFIVTAELHLAEDTLALHLLLQRLEGLVDIVIANENLHAASSFI